jgi:hypothetical protein
MKLSVGKIRIETGQKNQLIEQVLYVADAGVEIDYMQFVNNSDDIILLNLFVQFMEEKILLITKNFNLIPNQVLKINEKIYLTKFEKIIATADKNNSVEYIINGNLIT